MACRIGDGYMALNSADWTRYYAGWTDKLSSDVVGSRTDTGVLSYTIGQPYGVIGAHHHLERAAHLAGHEDPAPRWPRATRSSSSRLSLPRSPASCSRT